MSKPKMIISIIQMLKGANERHIYIAYSFIWAMVGGTYGEID